MFFSLLVGMLCQFELTPLKLARNRQQALSSCFILCELEPPFLIPNKHITKLVKTIMVQRESPLEAKG